MQEVCTHCAHTISLIELRELCQHQCVFLLSMLKSSKRKVICEKNACISISDTLNNLYILYSVCGKEYIRISRCCETVHFPRARMTSWRSAFILYNIKRPKIYQGCYCESGHPLPKASLNFIGLLLLIQRPII